MSQSKSLWLWMRHFKNAWRAGWDSIFVRMRKAQPNPRPTFPIWTTWSKPVARFKHLFLVDAMIGFPKILASELLVPQRVWPRTSEHPLPCPVERVECDALSIRYLLDAALERMNDIQRLHKSQLEKCAKRLISAQFSQGYGRPISSLGLTLEPATKFKNISFAVLATYPGITRCTEANSISIL
jgi:hypothetical protein